jgi:hypothetical protein
MTDLNLDRRRTNGRLPLADTNVTEPASIAALDYNTLSDHPYAADFPLIKDTDKAKYESLVASIRESGFLTDLGKIALHEGKIVDGRNRYRAAKEAGYAWTGREFTNLTAEQTEAYVAKAQQRRDLSMDDKKAYAKKLFDRHPSWDVDKVAEMAGISRSLAYQIKKPPEEKSKGYESLRKAWTASDRKGQDKFVEEFKDELAARMA